MCVCGYVCVCLYSVCVCVCVRLCVYGVPVCVSGVCMTMVGVVCGCVGVRV